MTSYDLWKTSVPEPSNEELYIEKYIEEKSNELQQKLDSIDFCLDMFDLIDEDKLYEELAKKAKEAYDCMITEYQLERFESKNNFYD